LAVKSILKFLARASDRIVVQSESTRRTLEADYGIPSRKVVVTELPGYPPQASPMVELPPPASNTILYFGFLAPYKGVEGLLNAFARARATTPARPLRLVIAGTNHPRLTYDYVAKLREKAARLGLGPADVEFPGYVDESASQHLFASSALIVLPYLRATGASGTLATAMGLNRPVFISDLPPLVGQLGGYPIARVAPAGDVSTLAETLRTVAEGRFIPQAPKSVGPGTVRRWEELVDRTAEVYNAAITARRRAFKAFGAELPSDGEVPA
jgi:glycosyltransferase involved in cell wall biosynthesis